MDLIEELQEMMGVSKTELVDLSIETLHEMMMRLSKNERKRIRRNDNG